jgi:hypothetical protein
VCCRQQLISTLNSAWASYYGEPPIADAHITHGDNGVPRLVLTPYAASASHDWYHSIDTRKCIPRGFVDKSNLGRAVDNSPTFVRGHVNISAESLELLDDLGDFVAGGIWAHDNDHERKMGSWQR